MSACRMSICGAGNCIWMSNAHPTFFFLRIAFEELGIASGFVVHVMFGLLRCCHPARVLHAEHWPRPWHLQRLLALAVTGGSDCTWSCSAFLDCALTPMLESVLHSGLFVCQRSFKVGNGSSCSALPLLTLATILRHVEDAGMVCSLGYGTILSLKQPSYI